MSQIHHLHDNERVLYHTHPSVESFLFSLLQGLWQGLIAAVALGIVVSVLGQLLWQSWLLTLSVTLGALCVILVCTRYYFIWKDTSFTVTSHRILLNSYDLWLGFGKERVRHKSFFHGNTQTVRWDTYQESVYEGGLMDKLKNTGGLTIRYGSADASRTVTMKGLSFAHDLKHYMDKIQSLKASRVADAELPVFVAAKRGKRG